MTIDWRLLPMNFPPYSTVYGYFRAFWQLGSWTRIWSALLMDGREQAGKEAAPSAAIVDSGCNTLQSECTAARNGLRLEIVKRPRDARGFHLLPRRLRGLLAAFSPGIG